MASTFGGPVRTDPSKDPGNNTTRERGTLLATQFATASPTTAKIARLPDSDIFDVFALVVTPGSTGAGGMVINVGTSGAIAGLGTITVSAAGLYRLSTGGTYSNHKGFSGDVHAALTGASATSEVLVGVSYVQR